jgi:hypothetical protein
VTVTVTLEQARAWIQVPASVLPDDELQVLFDAEQATQAELCTVTDTEQPALDAALLRRIARSAAAKGIPLGIVATDAEYGAATLPAWDAEVARYEGPWRIQVLA